MTDSRLLYFRTPVAPSRQQQEQARNSSQQTIQRLPDVSQLLDSPSFTPDQLNGGDHYSRVAAAMAARELKKRESNGSLPSLPQRKIARGNMPPQRIQPDTLGGRLLPPQISGRFDTSWDLCVAVLPGSVRHVFSMKFLVMPIVSG